MLSSCFLYSLRAFDYVCLPEQAAYTIWSTHTCVWQPHIG